jgi:hypothetical protein
LARSGAMMTQSLVTRLKRNSGMESSFGEVGC